LNLEESVLRGFAKSIDRAPPGMTQLASQATLAPMSAKHWKKQAERVDAFAVIR
jgi:hypothetical protein